MQWLCFAFHYKPTISVYAKGSLYRGPIAVSLLRVGFSLLGNEGVLSLLALCTSLWCLEQVL